MTDYQYAHFDDPSVCQALDTKNTESIGLFLYYLKTALEWGAVKPNQTCVSTLLAIFNTELPPPPPNPEWDWNYVSKKSNKAIAQELLTTYFTPPMPVEKLAEAEEQKLQKLQKDWNPLLPEFVEHFPPELAGILGDYYSNCAVATVDGKLCGLGQSSGFDFKDPTATYAGSATNPLSCWHECSGDLCPQWLSSLLNNAPKVVSVAKIESKNYSGFSPVTATMESAEMMPIDGIKIEVVNPEKSIKQAWNYRLEVKTGSQATAEDIASACYAVNAPNEYGVEMILTLNLQSKIPFPLRQPMTGKTLVSFPEFEGGKYFVNHPRSWHIDRDGNFYTSLTLAPRQHLQK